MEIFVKMLGRVSGCCQLYKFLPSWRGTMFLFGNTDFGNNFFYKLTKAWKFDQWAEQHPKIDVLLNGMHWITMQNPAKSYETLIRRTFVKRNSSDDAWHNLHQVYGSKPIKKLGIQVVNYGRCMEIHQLTNV